MSASQFYLGMSEYKIYKCIQHDWKINVMTYQDLKEVMGQEFSCRLLLHALAFDLNTQIQMHQAASLFWKGAFSSLA